MKKTHNVVVTEQNCLDIARNYGCGIIIDLISAKYDSLSRIKNNKKFSKPASSKQKKVKQLLKKSTFYSI